MQLHKGVVECLLAHHKNSDTSNEIQVITVKLEDRKFSCKCFTQHIPHANLIITELHQYVQSQNTLYCKNEINITLSLALFNNKT